ncbi:unnamed protein product [Enterobius vermicularis]|uniref:Oxidoreductase-like domain-containing protein n=1 Tax=Enterobius vermicularis TaxID=51028 RepID=A0A0N4V754_ENTVE|nr:unnamed protein product [Enterobius vermicularis]
MLARKICLLSNIVRRSPCSYRCASSTANQQELESASSSISVKAVRPRRARSRRLGVESPDPKLCCGSGCLNCVWIEYGVYRTFYYSDEPIENTLKIIDENVTDGWLRDYVKREIRQRTKR